MKALSRMLCGGVLWIFLGCGGAKPEAHLPPSTNAKAPAPEPTPAAAAPEPARVLPELRTGTLEPSRVEEVVGEVVGYLNQDGIETFKVTIPRKVIVEAGTGWLVLEDEPLTGPVSVPVFVPSWEPRTEDAAVLWLRRKAGKAGKGELKATLLLRHYSGEPRVVQVPVSALIPAKLKSEPKLRDEYLEALRNYLYGTPMASLLSTLSVSTDPSSSHSHADWSSLMRLMSGYDSVEGALLVNAQLRATVNPAKATVPLATLATPEVDSHPWQKMLAALPKGTQVSEPLAAATPNDFYFVRAESFEALQLLLDEADTWVTAGVRLARAGGRRYDLVDRYRRQLGLSHSEWTRWLGPKLVHDLALVGSDPFVRQGSDVTLLVRPRDQQAFKNTLTTKLAIDHAGAVKTSSATHAGVSITHNATADGVLRQYVAHLPSAGQREPLSVVSNSAAAIRRVIDAALGNEAALSAELDFQYIAQRDAAVPSDIFAYFGDRFVQNTVGPRQRILDARRQLALAELSRLGYGALLFGWVNGREPNDTQELLRSRWLGQQALRHTSGEAIRFELAQAPVSSWGTPAFLTPLIDLPTPLKVTPAEQQAYQSFAQSYTFSWSEHVDPIGARFRIVRDKGQVRLESHVRVLPVINTSDYREVWRLAGEARLTTRANLPGLLFTLGIGKDSELRAALSGQSRSFLGKEIKFDWLGDWVSVGVGDEPALAQALKDVGKAPELPNGESVDELEVLSRLPLFVALDIKRASGAALILTTLRKMAQSAAPDVLTWNEQDRYRDVTIVHVKLEEIDVYYSLTPRRLFVTTTLPVLRSLLDAELDGRGLAATNDPKAAGGGQLVLDLRRREPSGLLRALGWAIEQDLRENLHDEQRPAEIVLRGTPTATDAERKRLALNYLGYTPVTPEGAAYTLNRFGIHDPLRGTAYRPTFPDLPAPGSPLEALLNALGRVHGELAFDAEPGTDEEHSLRAVLTFERPE